MFANLTLRNDLYVLISLNKKKYLQRIHQTTLINGLIFTLDVNYVRKPAKNFDKQQAAFLK